MDTATVMWGLLFGAIGTGYFVYGKKQRRAVPLICGILLIAFPWFVTGTLWLVIFGTLLSAIPYFVRL